MAGASLQRGARAPRSKTTAALLAVFFLAAFVAFVLLGSWQVQRRAWKLDLIERVEQRVHAAPTPAPGPDAWAGVSAATDEYRHVTLAGVFLHQKEALVQATTVKGGGFWVLTPFDIGDGTTVLVNRGFVAPENRALASHGGDRPVGLTTVTGLLRMTEPGGGFLRKNDPAGDRWYSRDVAAIAAARGLDRTAPYFVDADAAVWASADEPVGGLTVISFPNSHLVYAVTWFGLAALTVVGAFIWLREERRPRRAA
ncbi:SURF1 family protein [Xylophilus sp. GOD-11R]|uniref:SURF1 family protein n=1 Tax=Xylophilus sp. GOD-11R TaxID=3089814 RepID=UPI00298D5B99|nr:SURF1 family protein [Xylophilus sp. GOD-11R]WPB59328.1 SURF1 family protein [Xylophilus sp. GOD-11R]